MEQSDRLCRRLSEHRKNIRKAANTLDIADFEFRSLVVQSGWETPAEDYLIHLFRPIWNKETGILYGLDKHGDNAKTRANNVLLGIPFTPLVVGRPTPSCLMLKP